MNKIKTRSSSPPPLFWYLCSFLSIKWAAIKQSARLFYNHINMRQHQKHTPSYRFFLIPSSGQKLRNTLLEFPRSDGYEIRPVLYGKVVLSAQQSDRVFNKHPLPPQSIVKCRRNKLAAVRCIKNGSWHFIRQCMRRHLRNPQPRNRNL